MHILFCPRAIFNINYNDGSFNLFYAVIKIEISVNKILVAAGVITVER